MALLPKYGIVSYKGFRFDRYTVAALKYAEKKSGMTLSFAQGSYNAGGVAASGGTHDGGGAVDIRIGSYTDGEIKKLVNALKDAGFAAWHRKPIPRLWGAHIHAIQIGNTKASGGAKAQVLSYDAHRDGLRGNAWDATYRPNPRVVFNYLLGKPVKR